MQIIRRELCEFQPARHTVTEPVARVKPGEEFIVEAGTCCQPVVRTPSDVLREHYIERAETGPIYVEGIKPGDMLRINIKKMKIVGHGSGFRHNAGSEELDYEGEFIDFIEIKDHYAVLPGGLHAKTEPMIGVICTVPKLREGEKITDRIRYDLGDNGGNMDYKEITAGNSLCLKAEHEGGLIFIGDCHAGQGWGEWMGVAIECAADLTISVEKEEKYISGRPVLLKENSYTCIACRWPYADAVNLAMEDAAKILVAVADTDIVSARRYCRLLGNVKNGMICHMGFEKMPDGKPISGCPVVVGVEVPIPVKI